MSLTDLLDLAGSLLLILAVAVEAFALLGLVAALVSAGVLILALSYFVGRRAAGDEEE